MWELIELNKRKSLILFAAMGFFLLSLGFFVGQIWFPPDGGFYGIFFALILWSIMALISYSQGSRILLSLSRAQPVSRNLYPQLYNIVEEMKIAANMADMPKIYLIDDPSPNAFACGLNTKDSAVVVTAGLLGHLNRNELQGVIAHELSHITNRDVLYMTFASIMLGSIVLISQVFFRSFLYGSSSRRYRSSSSNGGGGIFFIVAIVFSILAPIIARIFYFSLSRKREYLADACAVRLTRYPKGLADALEKISKNDISLARANSITAPMYIDSPLKKKHKKVNLFSTHPPIEERIAILRNLSSGVNYLDYQKSFNALRGIDTVLIPQSGLANKEQIRPKAVNLAEESKSSRLAHRETGDIMRAINDYAFLICACGLKIKVPQGFDKPKLACPRCNKEHIVPVSNLSKAATILASVNLKEKESPKPISRDNKIAVYKRKSKDWETFSCECGQSFQLSPAFSASEIFCHNCGKKIEIV